MSAKYSVGLHAARTPAKPAIIMGISGETATYIELESRTNQGAHFLRSLGLGVGDALAICIDNSIVFLEVAWAALRSGLALVPISTKLTASEIAFIVHDSGAKALVAAEAIGEAHAKLPEHISGIALLTIGGDAAGYRSWSAGIAAQPASPIGDEHPGSEMLYSSGTTGRPKGICYPSDGAECLGARDSALALFERLGFSSDEVYLCPAPLYHSAPFAWTIAMLQMGATVVIMEKFDPEMALALIDRHRVTVSQWVPTHFVRMLKLPVETRRKYDVSSMKLAIHAAAPCPVAIKSAMLEWWGPRISEYYGSSEQTVLTFLSAEEALAHPGSVGRCIRGKLHICDEEGEPVPVGEVGQIFNEAGIQFSYRNDPEKTKSSRNRHGWTTVKDMGHLDAEGYLYLADRKDFMIITGGVNVYPQEIENFILDHPRIADVAVIGMPDSDYGEIVTAVIQPVDMTDANETFEQDLKTWLRTGLSSVKVPKIVKFRPELPRLPTGKMLKHVLRQQLLDEQAKAPQP